MIKLLILDVDGVLTEGYISYTADGVEMKNFHVRDGLGIKIAQRLGIEVAVISGRHSAITELRCKELGITRCIMGRDKLEVYNEMKAELGVTTEETAFIGDDFIDLKLLREVGLSAAPADAPEYIRSEVAYVTSLAGGQGAVRELIDEIIKRNGQWEKVYHFFCS